MIDPGFLNVNIPLVNNLLTNAQLQAQCALVSSSQIIAQIQAAEPWYCPINTMVYVQWAQYLPIAIIATLIAFFMAAIIFMSGVVLKSEKIRGFGISEIYEAIATAIIVGAFMYLTALMFGLIPGELAGAINPYATAFNLISETINAASNLYANIYSVYIVASMSVSAKVTISGGGSGLVSTILGFLGATPQLVINAYAVTMQVLFLDPASAISAFLTDGITILYGEYYLLAFFAVSAIPVFLIPGVILRALFPTRALGGVMISMAIGFYLIMPSLFALAYYFTAPSLMRDISMVNNQFAALRQGGLPNAGTGLSPNNPLVVDIQDSQSALSGFWMLMLFYPALIIVITYSFVQQMASVLGGTYKSTNRLRGFI
jgi:hypothetical protein